MMYLEYYLAEFDHEMQTTRTLLARVPDASASWCPHPKSTPRAAVLRTYLLNHVIHHRGQLSVYLRLLDVPLPSMYGPTADEAR